jgi:DNA (cytosine-5)-methyltransferase 1
LRKKYAYYNEIDPKCCAWLRQLIKNGMIMDGEVDERSIIDVQASDLVGFCRQHFFSGIGGWDYALKLANWPQDKPVCTASLLCQPFSVAGKQKGKDDERHLLPHFIELVKQCNFRTIFGEQVPGAIKHGWLDDLCIEMERENYAVGAIVLTASGAGSAHIRQRLYWVADTISAQEHQEQQRPTGHERERGANSVSGCGLDSGMVYTNGARPQQGRESTEAAGHRNTVEPTSGNGRMGNTEHDGQPSSTEPGSHAASIHNGTTRKDSPGESTGASSSAPISEWTDPKWIYCRDNKYRPIKPCIKPLANGLPKGMGRGGDTSEPINADDTQEARVMRLKGYGNAIVPQVAAQFIQAFMNS